MNHNSIEVLDGANPQQQQQTSILKKGKYCKYDPNYPQATQGSLFAPNEQMSSQALDSAKQKSTNGMISIAELLKQQSMMQQPQFDQEFEEAEQENDEQIGAESAPKVLFDEQNIEELDQVAELKRKQR